MKIFSSRVAFCLMLFYNILNSGEVVLVDKPIQECKNVPSISKIYYLDNNKTEYQKGNLLMFWNSVDAYIGSTFQIKIYASDPQSLSGCTDALEWQRYSEVAPGENKKVVAFGSDCVYRKPTKNTKRKLQFYYLTQYADINTSGSENAIKYYTIYDENGTMNEYNKKYNNYFVSRPIKNHAAECLNVELRYCGDGILDEEYGEECELRYARNKHKDCDLKNCKIIRNHNDKIEYNKYNFIDTNFTFEPIPTLIE